MLWVTKVNYGPNIEKKLVNTSFYKDKSDYTEYLTEINVRTIGQYYYSYNGETDASLLSRVKGMLSNFHQRDTLIVQFPVFVKPKIYKLLADYVHDHFNGKIIGMIHEERGLKFNNIPVNRDAKEKSWNAFDLGTHDIVPEVFDALIVQSEQFKLGLQNRLEYEKPIIVQGPYGYKASDDALLSNSAFSKRITLVDNLDTADYLTDAPEEWQLDIYGPSISNALKQKIDSEPNFNYHGEVMPNEMPDKLTDGFGLVWESSSFDSVQGDNSSYLKYRYPHKLSLYLASKIPVIIWKKAAAADWVVKNKLGFAVDNLKDIQPILDKMTEQQYEEYQNALKTMSPLILEGIFTKKAALQAFKAVNQPHYNSKF